MTQISNVRRFKLGRGVALTVAVLSLANSDVANAQIATLSDQNSVARVDLGSSAGMFSWQVEGVNQLNQQWFWLGVGNSAEVPINTISAPTFSQSSARSLTTFYANALYSVQIDYLLTGGSLGSGVADIGEAIRIKNTSGASLDFHFFQYSDFDLGGPGNDVIQLGKNLQGKFNEAAQSDGLVGLTETVVTPGANHGEAAFFNSTLVKLNDGVASVLNDNLNPVGPGDVTWAFQWDFTVASGGSFLISKDKYLQIQNVPEPSSMLLALLGGIFIRRFSKRA